MSAMMGGVSIASATVATAGNTSAIAMATAALSSNKYMFGLMIILINIGARYIGSELTEFQHKVLNHKFTRRLLIFLVIWMGTRDIIVAIVLTSAFIILVNGLFNENSRFCILPKSSITECNISQDEYNLAKHIVEKYEKKNNASSVASTSSTIPPSFGNPSNIQLVPKIPNLTYPPALEPQVQQQQHSIPLVPKQMELLNPRQFYGPMIDISNIPRGFSV